MRRTSPSLRAIALWPDFVAGWNPHDVAFKRLFVERQPVGHGAAGGHFQVFGGHLARDVGIAERGYRVVLNTNAEGGQTVFHLHLHLLGGRAMRWPPG